VNNFVGCASKLHLEIACQTAMDCETPTTRGGVAQEAVDSSMLRSQSKKDVFRVRVVVVAIVAVAF